MKSLTIHMDEALDRRVRELAASEVSRAALPPSGGIQPAVRCPTTHRS